uniref:Uncharacterized protein LOC104238058 n=1 Tax=Nicotiana sylvestris TaxID=4096 RepID=A0A1U7XID7_NICSY|nr:PREDICTED: uncharacterized protein LOC104238058 [Nicotiana sylvestris]
MGSGSVEAAEGLVNLSSHTHELCSSIEETLEDLLKKVGASYNPKKRRTPIPTVPSTARTYKKRKAASSTTTDIPLPKGRATRSKLKQSEDELQKNFVLSAPKDISRRTEQKRPCSSSSSAQKHKQRPLVQSS